MGIMCKKFISSTLLQFNLHLNVTDNLVVVRLQHLLDIQISAN